MARFRGTVQGNRGQASRLGTKRSGLVTETNGWNSGVRVIATVDDDGEDQFQVYSTGGSSHSGSQLIATVSKSMTTFNR